jgi:hypothetical protein
MQEFTNETIDLEKLPKYQEIELTAPNPKYWNVIVINLFVFLLLAGLGLTAFLLLNEAVKPYHLYIISGYLLISILIFLLYRLSFRRRGFALREKDIVYKHGIIAETTIIIPLNRIQHVALDEGFVSRLYGLATLQIFTAGGQSGHMYIAGIEVERARTMKEALIKRLDLLETETAKQ